ncbi:MerR family transcriptional regulator [Streptomyces sp. MMCC 100]|uniref:MerR family transcriptional regulator n=1 Tax=Streptomyces sp. MMCC 100 TaxID=3163555 RepID=UPI0035998CDA
MIGVLATGLLGTHREHRVHDERARPDAAQADQQALVRGGLDTAGLSSRTIAELLPCVDSPGEDNSDAALERMARERDRLCEHIDDLVRTRDALNDLMTAARGYRETRRAGTPG